MKTVKIFDTTLRDGEQSPGCSMNFKEKLQLAEQIEKLNVDILEAGFAVISKGDFDSVKAIAETLKSCTVASLARAVKKDVDAAYEALRGGVDPRIHIFIATSDSHIEYKLKTTREKVLEQVRDSVRYARTLCSNVQFSSEDGTRSDLDFLCKVYETAIAEGATVINIADTVGYTTPYELQTMIAYLKAHTTGIEKVEFAVHCHNDLGMAVANSMEAIRCGADQIDCTVNGIGERAGNASLEEIVMGLKIREDFYKTKTNIKTKEIYKTSRMLSKITGVKVPPTKAIVGGNVFLHESGIHQHGVMANASTYEIMSPKMIGITGAENKKMVIGKHSGRHAVEEKLESLGHTFSKEQVDIIFEQFKILADKKKTVTLQDLDALARKQKREVMMPTYTLDRFVINSGNTITSTAVVRLRSGDKLLERAATADGPINASYGAINKIVGFKFELYEYSLDAVTEGEDALGESTVKLRFEDKLYTGTGLSTDVVEASIKAYINGINKIVYDLKEQERQKENI